MNKVFVMVAAVLLLFVSMADVAVVIEDVEAQQRCPWNGKVDIVATLEGSSNDLDLNECAFVVAKETKGALPVSHVTCAERNVPGTAIIEL